MENTINNINKVNNKRIYASIGLKLCLICFVIVGIILNIFYGFVGGIKILLYFTNQSNLWIMIVDIILVALLFKSIKHNDYHLHKNWYLVQQIFTVQIALTGLVYCLMLAPPALIHNGGVTGYEAALAPAIILHMIVPILAVVDFFLFTREAQFKKIDGIYSIIPPIYYFFFALIGYFCHWDFKDGNNYPYFFMNYANPAGIFGFSNEMPFMGTFYWDIIVALIVVGCSFLFIYIDNKIINKNKNLTR